MCVRGTSRLPPGLYHAIYSYHRNMSVRSIDVACFVPAETGVECSPTFACISITCSRAIYNKPYQFWRSIANDILRTGDKTVNKTTDTLDRRCVRTPEFEIRDSRFLILPVVCRNQCSVRDTVRPTSHLPPPTSHIPHRSHIKLTLMKPPRKPCSSASRVWESPAKSPASPSIVVFTHFPLCAVDG